MSNYGKMMGKKKKDEQEMSPMVQKTKMGILENLRDQADGMMGEKLANLKKVTVASDSKEGLGLGLEKAREMLQGQQNSDSEDSEEHDAEEERNHLEENQEHAEMDEESINAKLEELMKLKEKLAARKM